jgi:hypothetical protein
MMVRQQLLGQVIQQHSDTVQSVHYELAGTISPHDASTSRQQVGAYLSSTDHPMMSQTGLPIISMVLTLSACFIATALQSSSTPSMSIHGSLSPSQRIKLNLHEHCNHVNFGRLNAWFHHGVLPVDRSVANAPDPICSACQFSKVNKKFHSDEQSITINHTAPGQGVSMDLMEAGIPGRLPTTRGLPLPKRYKYVTLWIDHYSRYLYPTLHEMKELSAALQSKQEFEAFANRFSIRIESIRADNGVYVTKVFS